MAEKLQRDLHILGRFAEEMAAYLDSATLFWSMGPNLPQLTLGGYLMRQYRLLLLRDLLDPSSQNQLDQIVTTFQLATEGRIVRLEDRAHQEMEARLRQWVEYLKDVQYDRSALNYYKTAVEARLMLDMITQYLAFPPYKLNSTIPTRLQTLDKGVQARWRHGDFVWAEAWESAYPQAEYWYLYGTP